MIYLDSAAVVKLVRRETHSAALVDWLRTHPDAPLVSSALLEVEVPRALQRSGPEGLAAVPSVLNRVSRIEMNATVRATAAAYTWPQIRSLDAIHLATAQVLDRQQEGALEAFVTYDQRLLEFAGAAGLVVASPVSETRN